MKEKILELKQKGYSYQMIRKELGCSKSTISYYIGDGQKIKAYDRVKKQRKLQPWLKKSERFFSEYDKKNLTYSKSRGYDRKKLQSYLETITKCYLSGRPIDISDFNTYEFDHITPRALGGEFTFENLGVARPEANRAKGELTVDEFISLCKDVLVNFGYDVNKK
jgi:CRISPR/Cas system Type II protein with McrA/HNH and RuvC-like nuclease domain